MTCRYRCGDACFKAIPNTSGNDYFGDVVAGLSRRSMLKAGGIGAVALGLGTWGVADPAGADAQVQAPAGGIRRRSAFEAIASTPADVDDVIVPAGYRWSPIISWGDPIKRSVPDFDFDNQSVEAQKNQAGYNCDYTTLMPDGKRGSRRNRGVLCSTTNTRMTS